MPNRIRIPEMAAWLSRSIRRKRMDSAWVVLSCCRLLVELPSTDVGPGDIPHTQLSSNGGIVNCLREPRNPPPNSMLPKQSKSNINECGKSHPISKNTVWPGGGQQIRTIADLNKKIRHCCSGNTVINSTKKFLGKIWPNNQTNKHP